MLIVQHPAAAQGDKKAQKRTEEIAQRGGMVSASVRHDLAASVFLLLQTGHLPVVDYLQLGDNLVSPDSVAPHQISDGPDEVDNQEKGAYPKAATVEDQQKPVPGQVAGEQVVGGGDLPGGGLPEPAGELRGEGAQHQKQKDENCQEHGKHVPVGPAHGWVTCRTRSRSSLER